MYDNEGKNCSTYYVEATTPAVLMVLAAYKTTGRILEVLSLVFYDIIVVKNLRISMELAGNLNFIHSACNAGQVKVDSCLALMVPAGGK